MKVAILILLSFTLVGAEAQVRISGKITDTKNKPLRGISIAIRNSYDGGTTDSTGNYSFTTTEKGEQFLDVSATGYKPSEQKIIIASEPITASISIKELVTELNAVVITAGSFEASDSKRTTVLNPIDIVTTASANADVTGAIKTLPGTQQVGNQEGLFVRGGTAAETKAFIDGTVVNNFYFSSVPDVAQRGRFSPFLFKGTVFSSGGYSAQYGQALSSVLLLESIDLPEQSSADIGISTVGLSAGYQKLAKNKKSSWGISFDHTNLILYYALVKQKLDYFKKPMFNNAEANFRVKTSKTGMLKFYGYFNSSRLGIRSSDIDSANLKDAFGLNNFNVYANLSLKEKIGKWKMNLGASYTNNRDKILSELQDQQNIKQNIQSNPYSSKNFNLTAKSDFAVLKAVFERRFKGLNMVRFGGEYFYNKDRNVFSSTPNSSGTTSSRDNFVAGFAETDIYVTPGLAAKVGVRTERSELLDKANIAPRISLAYKLGKGQVSLAYGNFYQKPENSFFTRGYKYNSLDYAKATHYIANYQKVSRDYTLRIEAFYKKYNNLMRTFPVNNSNDSISNSGHGGAKGIELFWRDRKTIKNLDYWLSYSYLDTKREFMNYPGLINPTFAAKHTASLVVKKFVMKLKTQFNASYTFSTGRPYYNIRFDNNTKAYKIFDQGRTINYNSLAFSVNYLPNINKSGAGKFSVLVFSVTNVLNSNQEFGFNYSYNGVTKRAITPPARQFFFLGYFLSFGVDKTEDVINSNL